VGLIVHHKVGDFIKEGEPIITFHANDTKKLDEARDHLKSALIIQDDPVKPLPLFYGVVH
jgi:pyrimidine-nucleoside phosphorylase